MAAKEQIIDRIRKMLALAEDKGASEGERDNALRMAHRLIEKHNLSESELEPEKAEERVHEESQFFGRPWAQQVSMAIARLFFCEYVIGTARSATKCTHHFIGKRSNAQAAAVLSEFVVKSIMSESKKRARLGGHTGPWARSFCWGAATVVRERIKEMREASELKKLPGNSRPGTALVLADIYLIEKEANEAFLATIMKTKTKRTGGSHSRDSHGLGQGRNYGHTIPLQGNIGRR